MTAPTTPPARPFAGPLDSAAELAAILDELPVAVTLWDPQLRGRYANHAALDWYGRGPGDLLGAPLVELLGAADVPLAELARAGAAQLVERTVRVPAGSRQALIDYTPHRDGVLVLATDITEQAHADAAQRRLATQIALVDERERVASGMEEAVIGRLTGLAERLADLDGFGPQVRDAVRQAAQLVEVAVSQLRSSIFNDARTGPAGELAGAVRGAVENAARSLGFAPVLRVRGALDRVASVVGAEVVAVLIEALSNVRRHAAASRVDVTIAVEGRQVTLTVTDDGGGIRSGRRSGLANMQARAQRLGGHCEWRANEPRGTTLEWRAPTDRRSGRRDDPREPWQHRRSTDRTSDAAGRPPRPPGRPAGRSADVRLSAAELREVLDRVPAAISVWDTELRNRFVNRAGVEWVGRRDSGEIHGRRVSELVSAQTWAASRPRAEAALAGTAQLFERHFEAADGSVRHLQVSYLPRVVDGEVVGFFALSSDIGARIRADARLREHAEQITVFEERRRIAEDLHDLVIQQLFAAGLRLDAARGHGTAADRGQVDEATAVVDGAIDDLRRSIVSLRGR